MSKLQEERLIKEVESMGLDCPTLWFMLFELIDTSSNFDEEQIVYSKSYFSRYYCVDLETFNKWIRVFCPDIWNNDYKQKRKFTPREADQIIERLGRLSFDKIPPQLRKDLMDKLYKDKSWKKSRFYEELNPELMDRFPDENIKINKWPPKIIFEILYEEQEDFDLTISDRKDEYYRSRIYLFHFTFLKYKSLSAHRKEVIRRYLRRWFSATIEENDTDGL